MCVHARALTRLRVPPVLETLFRLYLVRINNFLPEEGILSGSTVKQAPVHAQVPDQCVQGADGGEDDEQIEEHVGIRMPLLWNKHTRTKSTNNLFKKRLKDHHKMRSEA